MRARWPLREEKIRVFHRAQVLRYTGLLHVQRPTAEFLPMTIDTATGQEAPAEISSERVKDIFSHIAKKYERFNALSSFGTYKLWLAGMMRQAPIEAHHNVLDVAGGTGEVTFAVAHAKHPAAAWAFRACSRRERMSPSSCPRRSAASCLPPRSPLRRA